MLSTAIYAKADIEALRALARPWPAVCVMSPLRQPLAGYLTVRRALGYKLARPEKLLGQLISYLEEAGAATVTAEARAGLGNAARRGCRLARAAGCPRPAGSPPTCGRSTRRPRYRPRA